MKNNLNLHIKTPCQENFDKFTITDRGGFCNSCQKEVIDFTTMSSEAIVGYFKTNNHQNTCGRFKNNQLKPQISAPKKKTLLSILSGIGLACLALFSFSIGYAQGEIKTTNVDNNNSKIKDLNDKNSITVKGTVLESGLPLPDVTVMLKGSYIGVQTDFDGYFEFPEKLKKGDVLVVSYLGFKTQEIVVQNKKSTENIELELDMSYEEIIVVGKVAVKEVYKSNHKN